MLTTSTVVDALSKLTKHILESVQPNGAWGESNYDDWVPITTALTLDFLLDCGFTLENEWVQEQGNNHVVHRLKDCVDTLNKCIKEDFSFGEDVWDALKLAIIIEKHNLTEYFPLYEVSKDNFITSLKERVSKSTSDWAGPGMIATAALYLYVVGEKEKCSEMIANLEPDSDGFFRTPGNNYQALPVWNTAQVIVCLSKVSEGSNNSDYESKIKNATEGITSLQHNDGTLIRTYNNYYFTAYAIIGLIHGGKKDDQCCAKAIETVVNEINKRNGHLNDYWATIMTAHCLSDYLGARLNEVLLNIKFEYIANSEGRVNELKEQIESLKNQNEMLNNNYNVAMQTKRFTVISIIITITLFIASLLSPLIQSVIVDKNDTLIPYNAEKNEVDKDVDEFE